MTTVSDHLGLIQRAQSLLGDAKERKRLGAAGHDLYLERFHVRHTIATLRGQRRSSFSVRRTREPAMRVGSI
jgi:hypothetical protein